MAGRDFSAELFGPSAGRDFSAELFGTKPTKERTWTEAAKDVAAGVVSGAGSLVQLPGQLYGLATGDFSDMGALALGKDISKFGEEMKSAGLKAREADRAEKIRKAEQTGQWEAFKTAFGETIKDPALLTSFLAEQAPQLLVPFGAAKVAKLGVAAKAATAAEGLTGAAAKEAVEEVTKAAATRATRAAIGAGAVQQGADVGSQAYEDIYKELISKGASPEDASVGAINLARAVGAGAAVISVLAQRLPGAKTLEESFAGVPGKGGRLLGGVKGALGEGASEIVEETGGKLAANIAMQQVKPEQSLLEGLGQTAGMAAVGGVGMGGVSGLARRLGVKEEAPPPAPAPVAGAPAAPTAPAPAAPSSMQDILGALFGGQPNVAGPIQPASGAGAPVAGEPGAGAAPGGAGGVDTSGVVPAGENVGQPPVGEGPAAAPVATAPTPAAPLPIANAVTDDFLNQLGIGPKSAIRQQVGKIEMGSADLVKRLTPLLINKHISDDVKANIRTYLETLKRPAAPAETAAPSAPATPAETAAPSAPATPAETAAPSAPATPAETAAPSAPATPAETATPAIQTVPIDAIYSKYTNNGGQTDAGKVADEIVAVAADALNKGQTVSYLVEGKAHQIVAIKDGMMQDNKGQRWGTLLLMRDRSVPDGARLQIGEPPATPTAPAAQSTPTQTASIQSKIDDFDSMFGNDGLPSRGTAGLTPAQQAQEARLEAEGKRLGVVRKEGETAREYWGRVKPAMALEGKISSPERGGEGVPLSAVPDTDIAAQEVNEPRSYKVTPEQRRLYEETREEFNKTADEDAQLPTFDKLRELHPEGVLTYFRDFIKTNSQTEHDDAAAALSRYLSDKRAESRAGASPESIQARNSYERERGVFGAKTGLNYSFPSWNSLSDEGQRLFTSLFRTDSALQQDLAFRAVKNQIQKEKLEAQQAETAKQAEISSTHEMLREAERARQKQPAGKGVILPEEILKKLLAGKITGEGGVLEYLTNNGKGIAYKGPDSKYLNLFSRELFRGLARVLNSIEGFKVNVVYDENMVLDEIGKYDASTNTLYLGPNGLDEATVLHELVHAGTVKIIHQYFTDKSQLSPRAAAAVGHLSDIAAAAKSRIGSRYPNAFENLYEFVAYAFTDLRFQKDLASIRIPSLAKATNVTAKTPTELRVARDIGLQSGQVSSLIDNLWDYFTGTIAYMYRLFYPRGKTTRILQVTEESRLTKATTALEKEKQKKEAQQAFTKLQAKEAEAEAKRIEEGVEEEPVTAEAEPEELSVAEKEALAPEKLFDDPDAVSDEEKAAAPIPEKEQFATQYGVTNLRRAILIEPGYKGNLLLEASSALQDILAAPEGGITQLAGKGLAPGSELMAKASGAAKPKQAEPIKIRSAEEITNSHPLGGQQPTTRDFKQVLTRAYPFIIRKFQNAAAPIKTVQEFYEKLGKITHIGPNINNVWSQMTKSSGRAWMNYVSHMMGPATELNKTIEDFAKSASLKVEDALKVLHSYAIMLHEPERRMVKYLKTVPLNDVDLMITLPNGKKTTPDDFRKMIFNELAKDSTTVAQAAQLRQALERIALPQPGQSTSQYWAKEVGSPTKRQPTTPEMFDITNLNRYNVAGLNGIEELQNLQKMFAGNQYDKSKLGAVMDALKKVHDATELMNREANYRGKGVDNVIAFYGYKNYVPLKGKPGRIKSLENEERELDPFASRPVSADLTDKEYAFAGRQTDSENPFLQSMAEGARAALRLGRKELTLAIKNAVEQKILHGDAKVKIPFAERFLDSDALKETEGETKILHYEDDGSITVIRLTDKLQREAIRRTYRTINPLVEKMNAVTSLVGQMHTRYNIPFAPMNFVRDALTNAFALGAEFGPKKSAQLIGEVARTVADGGFHKSAQVAHYLSNGNLAKVRQMATEDKTGFTNDLLEYLDRGGRVSYLQGLAARSQLDDVVKMAGRNKVLQTKDGINKFFDYWTDTFEFTSRVASYRVLKQSFMQENLAKGMSEATAQADAMERATEYAKNFANFEQVGEWGKGMGALFMFFRPAATGAVRAIEALRPAFGFNEQKFRERAEGKASKAEIDAAVNAEMKKVESARAMVGGLLGMGASLYIMAYMTSGDDDQGRNKVATDDPARWTRYARFFIPGMENPVQIPWGFGLGSFAATGAQVMSGVMGSSSTKEILGNVVQLGLDNFFPVPISRMNPLDNFPAWLMDTSMPSVARPFLEYVMNVDSLGREIYNNRQSRVGDAYTGGDSIPEIYKAAARTLFDVTLGGVDISPNTMYFWANNYADGLAKFASTGTNLFMVAAGTKSFNPKTDTVLFDSFFGAPSNFDAKQFSSLEGQIKALEQRLNTLKQDPARYAEFVSKNPMAQYVVNYYNAQINGTLKQTRQMMNDIRANRQYTPKERAELIDNIKPLQNLVKRNFINTIEQVSELRP